MRRNFQLPAFYPILDAASILARGGSVLAVADVLLAEGVRILQYRHKQSWTQREYDDAATLAERCREAAVTFVVNDRADYARLLGAPGLHVGQDDLRPTAARAVVGPDILVGFSTHTRRQLHQASTEPVDYLAIGPVFSTLSKLKPDPVLGLDALPALRKLTDKSLVAIGGITISLAPDVLRAGADSVAVISGYLSEGCEPLAIAASVRQWLRICLETDHDGCPSLV